MRLGTTLTTILLTAMSAFGQDGGMWIGLGRGARLIKLNDTGAELARATVTTNIDTMSVDGLGNAWALNTKKALLYKFDVSGVLVATYMTDRKPNGLAFDSSHRAWVLSGISGTLKAYEQDGTPHAAFSVPKHSSDVVVDWNGRMWVASPRTRSVRRYEANGALAAEVTGLKGKMTLALSHLGDLFVSQTKKRRISRINLRTNTIDATIHAPSKMTAALVDASGRVWFALPNRNLVVRCERDGSGMVWFGTAKKPDSIAISTKGQIWVACSKGRTVQRFSDTGSMEGSHQVADAPTLSGDRSGARFLNHIDPLGDVDVDGYSNRNEWVAGSDMADATALPAEIGIVGGGGSWTVTIKAPNDPLGDYIAYLTSTASPGTQLSHFDGFDMRIVPTTVIDPIFLMSGELRSLVSTPQGALDATGEATIAVGLPPELQNLGISFAFATLDYTSGTAPNSLRTISRAIELR